MLRGRATTQPATRAGCGAGGALLSYTRLTIATLGIFPMDIKWHARALVVCQILMFVPPLVVWVSILEAWSMPAQLLTVIPLLIVAALAPFFVFGRLLPAKCPHADCGGDAYPGFPKPSSDNKLIYRCKRCARTFDTGMEYDGVGPT